jgi:hypothetical protein
VSRPRDIVVAEAGAVELKPHHRPRTIRVAILPDDKGVPKTGPLAFLQSLQIAELGVAVLAMERTGPAGTVAAVASAGAYTVVLSPGDILGTVL